MNNTVPQELNWVEKRLACNIAAVFNQVCDGILADVEAFNLAPHLTEFDKFQAVMHSTGRTIIIGQPLKVPRDRVHVGIVNEGLEVVQEWDRMTWRATIGLNDEGRCMLRLENGQEIEQWQFRKRALENLFWSSRERQ
jgi:hypothetical protein